MGQGPSACEEFRELVRVLRDWRQWRLPLEAVGPLLALAIILIPAFWYGPWLPFTDMIGHAALDSYPPKLSYGPDHYYVLQLTYILPLILSRVCVDLGLAVPYQVILFYLLHAVGYFLVIWFLLCRFISNLHLRNGAIILGAMAYWDGLFMWGGPMAFSLGALLNIWALYLSLEEARDPARNRSGWVLLLTLLAVSSHPFAMPFGFLLYVLRLLFLKERRLNSVVGLGLLLLYQVAIRHEGAEEITGPIVSRLFGLQWSQVWDRFTELFTWNPHITIYLFGIDPLPLRCYFYVLSFLHLLGFVLSPLAFWVSRNRRELKFLFALNTIVGILYFISKSDADLIWWWPQRILTVYATVTYVAGIVAPLVLLFWARERVPALRFRFNNILWLSNWLLIGVASVVLVYSEICVFRLSTIMFQRYAELKLQIMDSGLKDTELELKGINTQPWFLRASPFILFSDPDLIKRGILVYTEWHAQKRHPTRINPYTPLKKVPFAVQSRADTPLPFIIPRDPKRDFNPPSALLPSK